MVGVQDDKALYLDPHEVQQVFVLTVFDLNAYMSPVCYILLK